MSANGTSQFENFLQHNVVQRHTSSASKTPTSFRIDVHRNRSGAHAVIAANIIIHSDRIVQTRWLRWVTSARRGQVLLYIEAHISDETPMQISLGFLAPGVKAPEGVTFPRRDVKQLSNGDDKALGVWRSDAPRLSDRRSRTPQKLLNSDQKYGFIFISAMNKMVIVINHVANWTQVLSNTTGECLVAAENARTIVDPCLAYCSKRLRLNALDGASAGYRADREVLRQRGDT